MRKLCILLAAAAPLGAQQAPPVRLIDLPSASSKPVIGLAAAVRAAAGRASHRQRHPEATAADVRSEPRQLHGHRRFVSAARTRTAAAGAIIPYFADSTLFIDPRDLSMFIIDPNGAISRVAAVPRSQDAATLGSNLIGSPALDSKGRIVYRGGMARLMTQAARKGPADSCSPSCRIRRRIVRVDLDDSKGRHGSVLQDHEDQDERHAEREGHVDDVRDQPDADGRRLGGHRRWTIAIIRGRDYHIDWVDADNHTDVDGARFRSTGRS